MSFEYTPAQREVIDARDCNVLVSAAAGSGKTAVLTERIVNLICDEEHPVDVDRLLVVTFTSAAAAEMRERIGKKLGERLQENPESERLQRQQTLLHNAQITTIDSFCLFLVKNHFNEIGLDPAFRVADEREIKLLQQEVLAELLEERFTQGNEAFLDCVEALCPKGREKVLEEHVLNLSKYAASFPWPEEWLLARKKDYCLGNEEEFYDSPLWKYFVHYLQGVLSGCVRKMQQAISVCEMPDGPYFYAELLEGEKEQMEKAAEYLEKIQGRQGDEDRIGQIGARMAGITFGKLPGVRDDSVDKAKREYVKDVRDGVKKTLTDLQTQFLSMNYPGIADRSRGCRKVTDELIDLVIDFDRGMREKKQEKKLIDFTDMEHFALDVLLKRDGERIVPSQVAMQYREYFREVLIDEYQDSNLVQEYLLRAVSGEEDGRYDRFMVGDVKQSIYHFRLARPELFMEKYEAYHEEGNERRIDLSSNFRSRKTVTDTVNKIFERAMSREVGGIVYDEKAALHAGATYPEGEGFESELLLVEKPDGEEIKARQAEALAIADRILEFRRNGKVTDKETGELRDARFQDVVILLRSLTGWGDVFKTALEERGIPAYVTSKSGYFTAGEVQDVLNYLRVIDNPLQDVPLFGVMKSFFGGFGEEEIAAIRGQSKQEPLYEALLRSEEPKVIAFLGKLEGFRERTSIMPIRALLESILSEYDYLNYVTALPGGSKRRANLEMLLVKASDFEKTSFYGLFHFLRYIEMLEKYEEDYGEADTLDENADVVRIMSIHKSKGLEFPVTIVAGLAKKFNMQDVNKAVILDADLGIGMDDVDPVKRLRRRTLQKGIVAKKLREDVLAEELRLLYVALTRAREKLIMTAEVDSPEEILGSLAWSADPNAKLTYLEFMKAGTMMDFLTPILSQAGLKIRTVTAEKLMENRELEQMTMEFTKESLNEARTRADAEMLRALEERFAYQYPYANLKDLYVKTTVSELKIAAMSEKDEAAYHAFEERETESYVPEFRRSAQEITGTVRGNAYHRVMELLDFTWLHEKIGGGKDASDYETYRKAASDDKLLQALKDFLEIQVKDAKLSEEYRNAVSIEKLRAILVSELGWRMLRAQAAGTLHREQPFVLAIPATRLGDHFPSDEKVLIQGIIDAYFVEEDEIVLLDYKTDAVPDAEDLWLRYETQMDHYQEALERLTGKKVRERILYSFRWNAASKKVSEN